MYEDKGWNFFARRGEATPLYFVYSKDVVSILFFSYIC